MIKYTLVQGEKIRVIQTLQFVSGLNTLLQALFGTRLPTVIGGSFAYVVPILYIIDDSSLQRISDPHNVSFSFVFHDTKPRFLSALNFNVNVL
jgi:xanthine/uracil permease